MKGGVEGGHIDKGGIIRGCGGHDECLGGRSVEGGATRVALCHDARLVVHRPLGSVLFIDGVELLPFCVPTVVLKETMLCVEYDFRCKCKAVEHGAPFKFIVK